MYNRILGKLVTYTSYKCWYTTWVFIYFTEFFVDCRTWFGFLIQRHSIDNRDEDKLEILDKPWQNLLRFLQLHFDEINK